ncbi:MAG: TonB-dependent receptor [Saprospirales bacterium]|nr:TonB-dependent receptor [Saprospirales bacterium]
MDHLNKHWTRLLCCLFFFSGFLAAGTAQQTLRGIVKDAASGEPLIGANVQVAGGAEGTVTDFDGAFELKTEASFPMTLLVTYVGYDDRSYELTEAAKELKLELNFSSTTLITTEIRGQRISEKQKAAPLTVESMDLLAIRQTSADNFYDGLGTLKGVDITAASIGFKIINTRGFNSTSPVRSLQLIDGVDNQAPGLNFSLGNFLGSPELDVLKVDLIVGASSAFYGPNAFNGVISMETKNPFLHKGLAASIKVGERSMTEATLRWANSARNKAGKEWFAYKMNFSYFRARDWEAENYEPVDGTRSANDNPGRWDAVNVYGDEYFSANDYSQDSFWLPKAQAGLRLFHRTGYREIDLVDYDSENLKANAAFHFRLNPAKELESPELILASSFGNGTTVYQGDNRFSLRGILFFQNRIELRKKDKFFLRFYSTNEDAGNSYDPYFTALRMQELAKKNEDWATDYSKYWQTQVYPDMKQLEYPVPYVNAQFQLVFDYDDAFEWLEDYRDSLVQWHMQAQNAADQANVLISTTNDYYQPGTERFQTVFDSITSLKNTEGGTRFFDRSALYHGQGEYILTPSWMNKITVGGSARLYRPYSEGTVFKDTADVRISNFEYGVYAGMEKKFTRKWTLSGTLRMDKNQNFDYLFTPAASLVWSPNEINYLRASFSSAIRNPTLTDQYLNLNVGPAVLIGNLDGFEGLYTVESFIDYTYNLQTDKLVSFNVAPVRPEKVRTFEVGYRTTLFDRLYVDMGYYFNIYRDFIGYNIGIDTDFDPSGFPTNLTVYRVAANSINEVTTQGVSVGANLYFARYYSLSGNYSWNRLNKAFPDDPIIPAFNTPEHKYNLGFSGRDIPLDLGIFRLEKTGFNINYKWVEGFTFEGSPQFTGNIPDYGLLDLQVNVSFPKQNLNLKAGASNLLDNKIYQTYGGPRIGRLAYVSLVYNWVKD